MQALLYVGLLLAPIGAIALLFRADFRATERIFAELKGNLERAGLPLRAGATPGSWISGGVYDGLSITIEPFSVKSGKASVARTAIRTTDPTGLSDAAIYRVSDVPADQLGALREVPFPELEGRFRCFAAAPQELQSWLGEPMRAALAAMSNDVVEVKLVSGTLTVVVDGTLSKAVAVLRCADLAAAIHHRRVPRGDLPYQLPSSKGSRWSAPAYIPPLPAFILGFVLPIMPGVPSLVSPLICGDHETLAMAWHQIGPGKYGGDLKCIDDATKKTSEAPFFLATLLHFNLAYFTMVGLLTARALTKREETDEVPAPLQGAGQPYR